MPSHPRQGRVSSITSVIFDFGGVLGLHQDPDQAQAMADLCGLPMDRFRALYVKDRLMWDRATVDAAGYWGSILAAAGRTAPPDLVARLVRADIAAWTRINRRVVAWADGLRRHGYRTAILSNMPQEILDDMWKDPGLQWMADFPVRVFSCEVRLVKPEPEIYRLCLDKLGAEPGEAVFVDDTTHNVEGAQAVGIQALLFLSAAEAAVEVERRWGLPVDELRGDAVG
jgi:putative hydrolase of the HAD superfamily